MYWKSAILSLVIASCIGVSAHESHAANNNVKPEGKSWLEWHMEHEHGIDADNQSAFKLHDTRGVDRWNDRDILRMYGLSRKEVVGSGDGMGDHDNTETISEEEKRRVVATIMAMIDKDQDNEISLEEWLAFTSNGGELPDFGYGPGHEWDFEEEYERHHWLQYHAENDPDVLIQHPEDIEHELLHHLHEIEHEEATGKIYNKRFPLKLENVPSKFRVNK